MSTSPTTQSVATLKTLLDQLLRLEGGALDIGGFKTWFNSLRWDTDSGFNTEELAPLGWAIETSLFEFNLAPDDYLVSDLLSAVQDTMERERIAFPQSIDLKQSVANLPPLTISIGTSRVVQFDIRLVDHTGLLNKAISRFVRKPSSDSIVWQPILDDAESRFPLANRRLAVPTGSVRTTSHLLIA